MKKLLLTAITAALILTLAACGKTTQDTEPSDTSTVAEVSGITEVADEPYSEEDETGTRVGTYTGKWRDGKPNGNGRYEYVKTQLDGTKLNIVAEGTFADGKLSGDDCVMSWEDGTSYSGQMLNGERHGQGVWSVNDFTYDGVWANDVLVSGKIYQGSYLIFDGEMPPLTDVAEDSRFAESMFGDDPEEAERGFDDEQFKLLETAVLTAIKEADPEVTEMEFVVPDLPAASYKLRKALQYIMTCHPVYFTHLLFSYEQAYADQDDPKSEKIGVEFSVISVTKTPFGKLQADIDRFYAEAEAVAATLPDDPREAVIALDAYMCETFDYDYEALESGRVTNLISIDDISIDDFFDKKLGVCSHYASFSYAVLEAKGIPARLCTSEKHFMHHEWHQALIDGEWLNIDSTWNDTGGNSNKNYLLLTDEEFRSDFDHPHYNWTNYGGESGT
ncbi:MAG: hypothetical protein LBD85_00005 [Oscillospiraceae bacterium]|jgi:transglutaminase-like putative cysteine protease|nr:hypothetical protein [Oscillospiraceae bacterium]